ncbi:MULTISPECIES: PEP-CTERM sorting domain-containing protein [unclassified Colwellia]|uniref:PEP-CTERM sorting domain-containing protein n=1 Tax=unclassified Colwellia TaxID=196834 RepID=UPI0015F69394|nr:MULTISPECIES: PEP-CTERM sorting domain-containing protein [unclassified Colwellia]MBA6233112.1 PEP-CTERM sorting domain-containing protein [Colwellia sp. MB02u-7]MBA6236790.1 PEP-CTERM sorting domain-containing protein [Colwellia sp. MB02u-11]MBA6255982.1 PEP-CTERM sorting domain-containing protein [Colwellia sp. MB3u-28]MBA6259151.1 PEP-CTERM sorting domain-containing protein [Colwellia sp. MB3u-41]MBA6299199.1 PEP-CTERM sorting domain-containing protein [Colwellia sp. MB3u-22]
MSNLEEKKIFRVTLMDTLLNLLRKEKENNLMTTIFTLGAAPIKPLFSNWFISLTFLLGLAVTSFNVSASLIKTMHIQMPSSSFGVNDMHVSFFDKVTDVGGASDTRTNNPSDRFDGVSGVDSNTLNFAAPANTRSIDNFNVKIQGNPVGLPLASNIVTKVEFTKDGKVIESETLELGTDNSAKERAKTKKFKKRVTGFTNDEAFDFSDLTQSHLRLFNTDASLNLRYLMTDFKIYTDLSLANFTLEDFMYDLPVDNLFLEISELVIEPGETSDFLLGSMNLGTYALATIGTLIVEDLSDGSRFEYLVPQGYAQTVVPEPLTLVIFLFGLAGVAFRRRM